jgi:predicted CopG family antitoxin
MSGKYRQVALSPENYKALKDLGKMGDTFDEVVTRLLRERKKRKR